MFDFSTVYLIQLIVNLVIKLLAGIPSMKQARRLHYSCLFLLLWSLLMRKNKSGNSGGELFSPSIILFGFNIIIVFGLYCSIAKFHVAVCLLKLPC